MVYIRYAQNRCPSIRVLSESDGLLLQFRQSVFLYYNSVTMSVIADELRTLFILSKDSPKVESRGRIHLSTRYLACSMDQFRSILYHFILDRGVTACACVIVAYSCWWILDNHAGCSAEFYVFFSLQSARQFRPCDVYISFNVYHHYNSKLQTL